MVFFSLAEVDRVRSAQFQIEAEHLRKDFSGSIADARCSEIADDNQIRAEIGPDVEPVNEAIRVLILAGMSTPNLRAAAERGVDVTGAGHCNWSLLFFATTFAVVIESKEHICRYMNLGLTFVFVTLLSRESEDKKLFASAAFVKMSFIGFKVTICVLVLFFNCALRDMSSECVEMFETVFPHYLTATWLVTIAVTLIGAGGVARIPHIGPFLAQLVYLGCAGHFSSLCIRRPRFGNNRKCTSSSDGESETSATASSE